MVFEPRPRPAAPEFVSESEDEERARRFVQSSDQQICFATQTVSLEVSDVGELVVCTVCAGILVEPTTVSIHFNFLILFF